MKTIDPLNPELENPWKKSWYVSEQDKQYTKREISMAMLKKTEASKKQKHQRELQRL